MDALRQLTTYLLQSLHTASTLDWAYAVDILRKGAMSAASHPILLMLILVAIYMVYSTLKSMLRLCYYTCISISVLYAMYYVQYHAS